MGAGAMWPLNICYCEVFCKQGKWSNQDAINVTKIKKRPAFCGTTRCLPVFMKLGATEPSVSPASVRTARQSSGPWNGRGPVHKSRIQYPVLCPVDPLCGIMLVCPDPSGSTARPTYVSWVRRGPTRPSSISEAPSSGLHISGRG